jgi:hypothetical protein
MRSNRNPSASVARSVVERNSAVEDRGVGEPGVAVGNDAKVAVPRLPASLPARMPMEWLDSLCRPGFSHRCCCARMD